ncbi:MAG: DUF6596 domain-containing protein [Bacteroidota bacterium]
MERDDSSLKNLFQQEFARMVAVISRRFGLTHIEMAEDVVSATFLQAAETWGLKGLPPNPTAWLYAVARQKVLEQLRRRKIFEGSVLPELQARADLEDDGLDFSEQAIRDSQLQMIFAVCTPEIASEAQIGLALRILCGFGIDEIAEAFFSNKETINKRLLRAKEKLRGAGVSLELPSEREIPGRLDNVLHVLYLLFNEGYYSRTQNQVLRMDFCLEAMRLATLLTEYEKTDLPKVNALLALMCFHASRFPARLTDDDGSILYDEQDEDLWDRALIHRGMEYLERSATGEVLSAYHLEARIASWHCVKEDTVEKWEDILRLYDLLLEVNPSPSVLLNRVYALYKAKGRDAALANAEQLRMETDQFYFVLLGELYKEVDAEKARCHFQRAQALARTETERHRIQEKIDRLA